MTPLTWQRLALIGAIAAALAWGVSRFAVNAGRSPAPVPWTVIVVSAAIAGFALWAGWAVRQYKKGDRPNLSAIRAARTAALAQATAYLGTVLAGVYAGYALALLDDWGHAPRRDVIISAAIAAVAGLGVAAAGWVAERWCRIDPEDKDDDQPPRGVAAA